MQRSEALLDISVIVPIYNAEASLAGCLDALMTQDYPRDRYEVIGVDNGSTDGSASILERFRSQAIILTEEKRGPAAARNAGAQKAQFDCLAFIDADAVASPDWLREFAEAARRNPDATFIGGHVGALDAQSAEQRYEATLRDQRKSIEVFRPPFIDTANLLMRKQRFFEIGSFDESFLRGEDSEISYRAYYRFGSRFAYAERAVVRHRNRGTLRGLMRLGFQTGWHGAHVWKRYERDFGRSRFRRAFGTQELKIVGRAWNDLLTGAREQKRLLLCDALFKTMKQIGLMLGTFRW